MPKKKARIAASPQTLQEAIDYFADENTSLAYLVARRWPTGVICPTCGSHEVTFLKNQRRWKCSVLHARRQFSVKVGTIMEDSAIPLSKWLSAMWMIANCKNGISSYDIHRALDITQKTAWFLLHRIRLAMHDSDPGTMSGEVEADETYIGGLARNMHKERKAKKITGTGGSGKTAVMGLLERHTSDKISCVKATVLPHVNREHLHGEIRQHVEPGTTLYTDALAAYYGLDPEYVHKVIDHAEAKDTVHTNSIENFWSLLKRTIKGTYVSVEPFHLFRYLDEQGFRFNERKTTDGARFTEVAESVAGRRLTYNQLTGKTPEPSLA